MKDVLKMLSAGFVGAVVASGIGWMSRSNVQNEVVTRRLTVVDAKGKTIGSFGMEPGVKANGQKFETPILKVIGDNKGRIALGFYDSAYNPQPEPLIDAISTDGSTEAKIGAGGDFSYTWLHSRRNTVTMTSER
jgi:hypothetical protein